MATRDWFTDCSGLFMRHSCKILSTIGLAALTASLWYAGRIDEHFAEAEVEAKAVQSTLQQIQIDVGIIKDRQSERPDRLASNE
jgi:hypothetical protein